jgi:hypothetical protein
MARIRMPARRPSRLTSTATETLSIESKFATQRRGIGSDSGSRITSLASPRMVVVQGATSARRRRGIAASRDSTTTGRRPISAISHHHTSPRAGSDLTSLQRLAATTLDRPTRRARRPDACHRPHSSHPPQPIDDEQVMPRGPHRSALHQSSLPARRVHCSTARRRQSCLSVCDSCHNYATGLCNPMRLGARRPAHGVPLQ